MPFKAPAFLFAFIAFSAVHAQRLLPVKKQDAAKYSSIQGVIALDGLDTDKLYAEDGNGKLSSAN
jgi:hypothetical protein